MCGISVARCRPARSAASAGASVRMSLTTTSKRSRSISGSSASAASAAVGLLWPLRGLRRKRRVLLGGGEADPKRLDRLAPALPRLDQHVIPALAWSARASPIAGNAWPASPNAATITLQDRFPEPFADLTLAVISPTIVHVRRHTGDPARRLRGAVDRFRAGRRRRCCAASTPTGSSSAPTSTPNPAASARCSPLTETAAAPTSPSSPAPGTPTRTRAGRAAPPAARSASCAPCSSRASNRDTSLDHLSIAELAAQIRAERRQRAGHVEVPAPVTVPETDRRADPGPSPRAEERPAHGDRARAQPHLAQRAR